MLLLYTLRRHFRHFRHFLWLHTRTQTTLTILHTEGIHIQYMFLSCYCLLRERNATLLSPKAVIPSNNHRSGPRFGKTGFESDRIEFDRIERLGKKEHSQIEQFSLQTKSHGGYAYWAQNTQMFWMKLVKGLSVRLHSIVCTAIGNMLNFTVTKQWHVLENIGFASVFLFAHKQLFWLDPV